MEDKSTIKVKDLTTLYELVAKLKEFQLIHNELRKDFLNIYKIASKNNKKENISPLGRACVKELFALIEADLYLINQFNPYPKYKDFEKFDKKFKATFIQHATTFNKIDIEISFVECHFDKLSELKTVRDNTTHPKDKNLIDIDLDILNKTSLFYNLYTKFISDMMTNVFISTTIPHPFFLNK